MLKLVPGLIKAMFCEQITGKQLKSQEWHLSQLTTFVMEPPILRPRLRQNLFLGSLLAHQFPNKIKRTLHLLITK